MNKKFLLLLTVFLVAVSIAAVCSVELTENKDFDGLFKMNVSANDNFTMIGDPQDYKSLLQSKVAYKNSNESVFVLAFGSDVESSLYYMSYGDMEYKNGSQTEGDLILCNVTPHMDNDIGNYSITTFAGKTDDHNTPNDPVDDMTIFIAGNNATLVKEYAKTIEFK